MSETLTEHTFRSVLSPQLRDSLRHAQLYALEHAHGAVTIEHLLLALLEEPQLETLWAGLDPIRLADQLLGQLHIGDQHSVVGRVPGLDRELTRLLDTAAGQRGQGELEGAVVLAVLMDSKHPAAGLLRANGLICRSPASRLAGGLGPLPPEEASDEDEDTLLEGDELWACEEGALEEVDPPIPETSLTEEEAPHAGGSHAGGSHAGGSHAGGSHAGGSHAGAAPYVEGLTPVEAAWAAGIPPDLSPEPELFDAPTVIDPRKSGLRPRHEPDEIEGEGTDEIQTETSTPEIFGSSRSDPDLPQGSYEPGGELPSEAIPTEEHATEEPTAEEHLVEPELSGPGSLSPGEPPEEPVFYGPVSHDLPPTPVIEAAGEGTSTASGSDTSAAAPRVGTLAENVPRSMKVEVPVPVEIRLAVGSPEGITADMPGDGIPTQRSLSVTRAMSVRLVAPRGGFFIEPLSPETQWVDDPEQAGIARWSWKITPKWSGNLPLSVVVSSRTVGAGGLSAESRLPDQTFEISVGANHGRRMRRAGLWVGTAVAGSVVGMWGQEAFSLLMQLLSQGAGLP